MMNINFTVSGSTVREIEEAAEQRLREVTEDPQATTHWSVDYDIRPNMIDGSGACLLWSADVYAKRINRRSVR
jgi:hypothetical protein